MKRSLTMLMLAVVMMAAMSATAGTAYDNALANLRSAYYLVDNHSKDPQAAAAEATIKNEIRTARTEIRNAGINDYKETTDHPRELEAVKDLRARLTQAAALLRSTRDELANADESTADRKKLKSSSLAHLNTALKNIDKLIAGIK